MGGRFFPACCASAGGHIQCRTTPRLSNQERNFFVMYFYLAFSWSLTYALLYRITRSARTNTFGGIVRPIASLLSD